MFHKPKPETVTRKRREYSRNAARQAVDQLRRLRAMVRENSHSPDAFTFWSELMQEAEMRAPRYIVNRGRYGR